MIARALFEMLDLVLFSHVPTGGAVVASVLSVVSSLSVLRRTSRRWMPRIAEVMNEAYGGAHG